MSETWLSKFMRCVGAITAILGVPALVTTGASAGELPWITLSDDGTHFVQASTGERFVPWGFNGNHDDYGAIKDDYWEVHSATLAAEFADMKRLGANVVRLHLQFATFVKSPTEVNETALQDLRRVVDLAQEKGLYLDLTGLACYRKNDVPGWYDRASDGERWDAQALFWEAVATTCADSPAVFCYDLMNEPVIHGAAQPREDWLTGELGGYHFVQYINRDAAGRTRKEIAKAWVDKLTSAIRKHDERHMITVGVIPWAHVWPRAKPVFYAPEVSENLDFVSVHFYPKHGEVEKAIEALGVYDIGKPLVVEELYPLSCSIEDVNTFIDGTRHIAEGYISHYLKQTPELRDDKLFQWVLTAEWLDYYKKRGTEIGTDVPEIERIRVSDDGRDFVLADSGERFVVWGVNYDHDAHGRLIEDYWPDEWDTVVADFAEMKDLGANVVRIHLQVARFMDGPDEADRQALKKLDELVKLAEKTGLYLDITGLGCYHKQDVPEWYDAMTETERWDVHAAFWEAVAASCAGSAALFCYDLINEPLLPGKGEVREDWLAGAFGDKYFAQYITRDLQGRSTREVAKAWVDKLAAAIRKHDEKTLITVGVIPWAHTWPNAKPLFYSTEVSGKLDFASVHFYPQAGQVDKAVTALAVYDTGKPVVVEEMFPLKCSAT